METPLELEIEGIEPSAHMRDLIASNIAKLEGRYGRITSCRVAIHAPGAHHRLGEPFAVSIRMALPGGLNVNVARRADNRDARQADIAFAITDAFHRATRQLRDKTRKLHGDVKRHDA